MESFEYLVRSNFHDQAENAARVHGGKERERATAYMRVLETELNKLGADGWELIQAPDAASNRNWIFKRSLARKAAGVDPRAVAAR
jgi:hypothetical protein